MRASFAAAFALVALATAAGAFAAAGPYVAVSAAEKAQTKPFVRAALAAQRRHAFTPLCDSMSVRFLRQTFRTRERCKTFSATVPTRSCPTCRYRLDRVVGVYATAADRRKSRKTVVWLYAVTGDPAFKGLSDLELHYTHEANRWVLDNIVTGGSTG
jgi:hypothetical protein